MSINQHKYALLTWEQVKEAVTRDPLIVIPTGATEPHGLHLPLSVDGAIAEELALHAAAKADKIEIFVTPALVFGASYKTASMPGALSLKRSTYITICTELCDCLLTYGFRRVCLLNAHGGNAEQNRIVARDLVENWQALIATANYWDVAKKAISQVRDSDMGTMGHACEMETSLMLQIDPDSVDMSQAKPQIPDLDLRYYANDMMGVNAATLACSIPGKQNKGQPKSIGVWGDPTIASVQKGKQFFDLITHELAVYFEHLYMYRRD